ncbi:carboxypeptidase-like regulatory domain-containing protein [Lutibacter sp.]|uniref:carboxypeptidase-like regulatory domain-containing protein n=1 Tax=Lutibacter sp. TaxID=1925666 RepID=UPI0027372E44|nr:carboxypeptidase-like regulatory domain-containing protein [Lutibacter sp.]MDP3314282.1 carboxypeptidase-like regulatory domain-containing protein [Lutibacter sp.]
MIKANFCFLFILFTAGVSGQTVFKGKILNQNNEPIPFVNVFIKFEDEEQVSAYTYSDDVGVYSITTNKIGFHKLVFSGLSFETKIILIDVKIESKDIYNNVVLADKTVSLNEVVIPTEKAIRIKKDTIVFKASKFLQGNEAVVEDLLKKIPGVSVDSEGTIKIGNQEIEKLMIDGDDFFDKGYKLLSKNMPPNEIDKIELLQKYSNNKLLKDIEISDRVALNLVLKEDAKRQWFGNFEMAYDVTLENNYSFKSNLMNFGKKNKYVFLGNINNIGFDATGDINHLIRPIRFDEPASIGDDQNVQLIHNLADFVPYFKAERTNINNTELVSLNAIYTVTDKVKVKVLGFLNWDEIIFFKNSTQQYSIFNDNFFTTENYKLKNKKVVGFGKLDLTYDISKTEILESITKFNNQNNLDRSDLDFNVENSLESLNSNNILFDQKISYTNKITPTKVLLLTARYKNETTDYNYKINNFLFSGLFPSFSATNNVQQFSTNQMQFGGFEAHFFHKYENDLLEFQLGYQQRLDNLKSEFLLKNDDTLINKPFDFQNNTFYNVKNLFFKSKYRYKLDKIAITGKLNFHKLFNSLEQETVVKQNLFFVNPNLSLDWEINNSNKIIITYSYNKSNASILDVYDQNLLLNFNSFLKGTGTLNQLDESSVLINYQVGDWSERFFANIFLIYTSNFDFFTTNSTITQNYIKSDKFLVQDRESFRIFSELNYYLKGLATNLKVESGIGKANFKNSVNGSGLTGYNTLNYNYGFNLRSGFRGKVNYHFGSKWNTNSITSTKTNLYTNNLSFFDLLLDFNDKLDASIQSERYYFGNIDRNKAVYYFLDFEARYKLKENKVIISLTGKNLFNIKKFESFSINDISTITTSYGLLNRHILFKINFRL